MPKHRMPKLCNGGKDSDLKFLWEGEGSGKYTILAVKEGHHIEGVPQTAVKSRRLTAGQLEEGCVARRGGNRFPQCHGATGGPLRVFANSFAGGEARTIVPVQE